VLRKAEESGLLTNKPIDNLVFNEKELQLVKILFSFPEVVADAGTNYSPALIANYIYDLAKEYNQFYHDCSI